MGADHGAPVDPVWVGLLLFRRYFAHEQLLKFPRVNSYPAKTKKYSY
jgi:hypothetical protein